MSTRAYKGRGTLTIGAVSFDAAAEITLTVLADALPVPAWPDLASDLPGGIEHVARRVSAVYLDMRLHDFDPGALALALGGSQSGGTVQILDTDQTPALAVSYRGRNKLTGLDWDMDLYRVQLDAAGSLPIVSGYGRDYGIYQLRGHVLRDSSQPSGSEYGRLPLATG